MHTMPLDPDEQELLASVENGEWRPVPQMQEAAQRFQQYATESSSAEAVTIHLPPQDMNLLRAKAQAEGVPYQTLIIRLVQHFIAN